MSRKVKPLSAMEVKNAKCRDEEYSLPDGDGLLLRIRPTGSKTWLFNYSSPISKKRTNIKIGDYPLISLVDARMKREEFRTLLAQGIDPQQEKKRRQLEQQEKLLGTSTFKSICEKWFTEIYPSKALNEETRLKNWARLENHIFPKLANVPLAEITPRLLIDVYRSIGASNTLDKIHRLVKATLDYGIKLGIIEGHNCNLAKDDFVAPLAKNHPAILPKELPKLLSTMNKAFADGKLEPNTFFAFNVTLLTGLRQIELTRLKWAFIDDEFIVIPSEMMKQTRRLKEQPKDHVIPLSSQMIKLLGTIRQFNGASPYLFPRVRNRNQTIGTDTVANALRENGYQDKQNAHGLRAVFRTYLSEQGFDIVVGELAIAHQSTGKGKVQAIYDRYEYLDERKQAYQQWGDYCEQCGMQLVL